MRCLSPEAFLGLASSILGEPLDDLEVLIELLGVDSLQALELILALEVGGVRLDEDIFIEAQTLGSSARSWRRPHEHRRDHGPHSGRMMVGAHRPVTTSS